MSCTINAPYTYAFDFPVELLRDIFDIAAYTHKGTLLNLSLVSTFCKEWSEIILFHTVLLERSSSLKAFARVISNKSSKFITTRIRNLGIFALGPIETIRQVVELCKGVQNLACGFCRSDLHSSGGWLIPKEQHLLGNNGIREGWNPSVCNSVTHLRILARELTLWGILGPDEKDVLKWTPSLTHLAIVYLPDCRGVVGIMPHLTRLLSTSQLQLLIVQVVGSCVTTEVDKLNALAMSKSCNMRLVAERAPMSLVRQWFDASRVGGKGIWEHGEIEVQSRMQACFSR